MKIEKIDIKKLNPSKYNLRKDLRPEDTEYKKIKRSIDEFGYVDPLIINKDMSVIGGHQRLKVLKELGYKEIDCVVVDLDKIKEKALNIALNKIEGEWDLPKLKDLLLELYTSEIDMDITGFEYTDLEELTTQFYEPDEKDDVVPEVPEEPVTKSGDLYQLGVHRLLCGDATKIENVERLMNGQKADMVFTDPPYNLGYSYNTYNDNKTTNEYKQFCIGWFNLLNIFSSGKIIITTGKQNLGMWYSIENPTEVAVWIHKNGVSGGKVSNLSLWESVVFYGKYDRNSRPNNLFEYELKRQDTGVTGKEHTCPKQVQMITDIVKSYSENLILDIFGGSGTTLIACEKLNHKCYMMEIDPHYCDVIVKRWEDYTEKKAEMILNECRT